MMKKLFLVLLILLFSSVAYAGADYMSTAQEVLGKPSTCLELQYDIRGSKNTEYIYVNYETQHISFDNGEAVEVLQFDGSIIKFKHTTEDTNDKGYIYETYYEINRYTGGCTVQVYNTAVSLSARFNQSFLYGQPKTVLVNTGTGTVTKVNNKVQKF